MVGLGISEASTVGPENGPKPRSSSNVFYFQVHFSLVSVLGIFFFE